MVAASTPSAVRYRLLSEHFQACVDLPDPEREEYLSSPHIDDPLLREELRSLLRYHDRPPEPLPPPASGTRRSSDRRNALRRRLPVLLLAVSGLLLLLTVRSWCLDRLEGWLKAERVRGLQDLLAVRVAAIREWTAEAEARVRETLDDPALAAAAGARDTAALEDRLARTPGDLAEHGVLVIDPSGTVLCARPDVDAGAALGLLRPGHVGMSRPGPDRLLGLRLDPGGPAPVLVGGGPIRDANGRTVAFGVLLSSPRRGLYERMAVDGPAQVLAFDERGLLLNDVAGLPALRTRLRDPGRLLKDGEPDPEADRRPPTRMCLSATGGQRGTDAAGYRDHRGRTVVGAWEWLPDLDMGIALEQDVETALAPLRPVRSGFAVLLSGQALLAGALAVVWAAGRRTKRPSAFGFYAVERPLGHGGMGDVFLATHTVLKRPAALKVLRMPAADAEAGTRFRREARLTARLAHPNAIQIFDYGETDDGRLYYAMEHVEGLTLAQLVALEGALPVPRALHLLRQVCGALEEAHAIHLLHRDLKPSNVMVGRKGGLGDIVKVLDFGIASSLCGPDGDSTRTMRLVGTPAYIAPERIRRPQQMDYRSDVYAFGGLAFNLLTGRSPFEGPGPTEIIYQILVSPRPLPSTLRGQPLPEPLERLVVDCLAVEPAARPGSMREIAEILKTVETPEAWSADDARAWWAANGDRALRFSGAAQERPVDGLA